MDKYKLDISRVILPEPQKYKLNIHKITIADAIKSEKKSPWYYNILKYKSRKICRHDNDINITSKLYKALKKTRV